MTFWKNFVRLLLATKKNYNHIFGSPTVCDDMLLASLSKRGPDELMRICVLNSCKWHYEYAPIKCCVVVYIESRFEFLRTDRVWHLGNNLVDEGENYKHLGVINNKYLSFQPCIKDATDKLKGTFLALLKVVYFMRTHYIL